MSVPASDAAKATAKEPTPEVPPANEPASEPVSSSDAKEASSSLGKRPRGEWFGAAGDGGNHSVSSAVGAKLAQAETASKLSSIKSKLQKPKPAGVGSSSGEAARRVGLTRDELLSSQERHREKALAKGAPVPHYRKA